jgi:alpha-L-fucosidase 2
MIGELASAGRDTARNLFDCAGWVCHHNTDLWRKTAPVAGSPSWAFWPFGGVWLTLHLWDSFLYRRDPVFLRDKVFPILEGAVRFCLDWLEEDDEGRLQSSPSTSPENLFYDEENQTCSVGVSSTMDLSLIRELFKAYCEACCCIGGEHELFPTVCTALEKIVPYRQDRAGTLLEWSHEIREIDSGHRHFSPLVSVYPQSDLIRGNRDTVRGAYVLFRRRLDSSLEQTGWNAAWISCLASRFGDRDTAWSSFRDLLGRSTCSNLMSSHNVLDDSEEAALFQIDGNYGGVAAILEMLVIDYNDEIELLPALPEEWKNGSLKRYRTKGGYTLSLYWNEGRLILCEIVCRTALSLTIKSRTAPFETDGEGCSFLTETGTGRYRFQTEIGGVFRIDTFGL